MYAAQHANSKLAPYLPDVSSTGPPRPSTQTKPMRCFYRFYDNTRVAYSLKELNVPRMPVAGTAVSLKDSRSIMNNVNSVAVLDIPTLVPVSVEYPFPQDFDDP